MGKLTRYKPLPDQAYDPRITDMDHPFNVPAATGPQTVGGSDGWTNRNISNLTPFQLVAGVGVRALAANPRRTGIIIQNKDPTATLFANFNIAADINSLSFPPGAVLLLDFTTVPGELYLFCPSANIQAAVVEISRSGGSGSGGAGVGNS